MLGSLVVRSFRIDRQVDVEGHSVGRCRCALVFVNIGAFLSFGSSGPLLLGSGVLPSAALPRNLLLVSA